MIPDEAVEAAKSAIWDLVGMPVEFEWQRDILARAALEAAAPHMLAGAWEEGRVVGCDEERSGYITEHNPYRPSP